MPYINFVLFHFLPLNIPIPIILTGNWILVSN